MISDVKPGGPAESAGMKIEDIVLSVDGRAIHSLPVLSARLYLHPTDEPMTVEVLRGTQRITMRIPVVAERHDVDRLLDLADPEKNLVPGLGVIAINMNETIAKMLGDVRINSGVVVVANTTFGGSLGTALQAGTSFMQ